MRMISHHICHRLLVKTQSQVLSTIKGKRLHKDGNARRIVIRGSPWGLSSPGNVLDNEITSVNKGEKVCLHESTVVYPLFKTSRILYIILCVLPFVL